MKTTNRRKVKSEAERTTNAHERGKDFLNEAEVEKLSRAPRGDATAYATMS